MRNNISILFSFSLCVSIALLTVYPFQQKGHSASVEEMMLWPQSYADTIPPDTTKRDTLRKDSAAQVVFSLDSLIKLGPYQPSKKPEFQPEDRMGDPIIYSPTRSPFFLKDPSTFSLDVEVDTSMQYTIRERVGENIYYRPTTVLSFEELNRQQQEREIKEYWKTRSAGLDGESPLTGRRLLPPIYISPAFDRVFGGSEVDIRPNGFVNLDFGGRWQRIDNPSINIRQQRNGGFEFDQQISLNVVGSIGKKLNVLANYDNNNTFDFENNMRLEYTGFEEDIIKKIEVGNVSLPLNNSLIQGAQNLFGVKTQLQFGRLYVTGIASTQRGKSEQLVLDGGGAQGREFEFRATDYDENRHFFLGHFFRDNYENWLSSYPQIISGINITRVEVYLLNRTNNTESLRNVLAMMDLGEGRRIFRDQNDRIAPGQGNVPTGNDANRLFRSLRDVPGLRNEELTSGIIENDFGLVKATDFEKVNGAKRLTDREFTFHRQLGYITLNRRLQNDEMLAVAFEYTFNGQRFKVGELTEDYQNRSETEVIFLKLLRPTKINLREPTWDLMMKNVYSLSGSQISRDNFQFRIIYRDDRTGIDNPNLQEGINTRDIPLIQLLGLDRLNQNNDPQPDGNFDFVPGVTIIPENGLILFPVLEPFGATLRRRFEPGEVNLINRFVFDTLYRTTRNDAEQITAKNKFFLRGSYQAGSSREISLPGINIAQGSVKISAGSLPLTEGVDYTVDYNLGRVTILNEGILNSGKKLVVSYEKEDMFNFRTRTLLGTRMDYRISDDFNIGGTLLYLNERPLVSRIAVGDEPTRNTKWGLDINYRKESRFITKMVDALPLIQTKEPSLINFTGEFAQLIPGTSNIVDGEGTFYIDDFEAAVVPIELGRNFQAWRLAATPKTETNQFDQSGTAGTPLGFAYKRAKLAWYSVDNLFYRNARPSNLDEQDMQNHYSRLVTPQEVFRQRDLELINANLPVFDLAYFPQERGMYNYNPNLTSEGLLQNPQDNWGGITRAITTDVDFDKTNVEYIEFWMMDPFIPGPRGVVRDGVFNQNNNTGGKLIFNLGSISEDVIPDGRHAYENGLPADGTDRNVVTNEWGRVTRQPFQVAAFDANPNSRVNQDVGIDGLSSEAELSFFQNDFINRLPANLNPDARQKILEDPSADDFEYFLSPEADAQDLKIIERYKKFNGMEGNTPAVLDNSLPYTPSSYVTPDNEDLNRDNTISDLEEYFEYSVDLRPGGLSIGENYVVDEVTYNDPNGDVVKWYLFRIPIRQPQRVQGNINGFKSIRFIRTYFTGWQQPVVLRMARMQLVGSQWRVFQESLFDKGLTELPEPYNAGFTVSVVNVEENGEGGPNTVPYVVPPGIVRDRDITSPRERRVNEQSLQLCVDELANRDARAVFKNMRMDLVQYGRLKMFLHAQSPSARDGEVNAFIRIGTDFTDNYYEVEVPLKITPYGSSSPDDIWPAENEIDLPLEQFYILKSRRNLRGRSFELPDTMRFNNYTLTIVGRPELSNVQTIMIGIRNPDSPDQSPKQICIWANELRLADFDRTAGYAANARVDAKLADLANVSASARYSTYGFGSIQQRISERSREEYREFDISASVQLDKFVPEKVGLKVPLFIGYQTTRIAPFFDPLDPDVPFTAAIASRGTPEEQEAYRNFAIDRSVQRSLNFTNVRKVKTNPEAKSYPWDVENLSFTYAMSELNRSNVTTASFENRNYRGGVAYNYSPQALSFEPLKNVKFLKSPYLKLFSDFNFSILPANVAVRGDLDRRFVRTQLRNSEFTTIGVPTQFEKFFTFNRLYNLRWNLTKGLSIDYSARVNAIIDEPEGDINSQMARDSIMTNLRNLGRMRMFDQQVSANYRVPLDKFPLTDWLSADLRYGVGYNWTAGSVGQQDTLGNTIMNNRERAVNGKVDLVKLYNKVKFLKEINTPPRPTRGGAAPPARNQGPVKQDTTQKKPELGAKLVKGTLRTLMSVRNINVTYSIREATQLSGFMKKPFLFGMDEDFLAPGYDFLLGNQDLDLYKRLILSGQYDDWLAPSVFLTQPWSQNYMEDLALRASVEPARDLRIQLDARKMKTLGYQEIFRRDSLGVPQTLTPTRNGSYSVSFLSIRTSFVRNPSDTVSTIFRQFEQNRSVIRDRLNSVNPAGEYQMNSQDVLVPAFLAAYSGQSAGGVALSPFPKIPLPNWRLDYAGLSRIPALAEIFSSINITHGYSSSVDVNNFTSSLEYNDLSGFGNDIENYPLASILNEDGNLVPLFILSQVMITERFAPLIGVNVRTKTRLTARVEYKTERNVALNLSNIQVTELSSNDISMDIGYTKAGMKLPFKINGETVVLKNDVQFRFNLTIRDTKTIQRKIEEVDLITNGGLNFQMRPTINYIVNQKLNLTFYFDRNINNPRILNTFPRKNTLFGVQVRFSLAQ